MMKKMIGLVLGCTSLTALACPSALPTDDAAFCSSFTAAAICYCTAALPAAMCQDMNVLYQRMLITFGSLERACEYQKYTDKQNCIDNWNCYLHGGIDSKGHLCSGTQAACV